MMKHNKNRIVKEPDHQMSNTKYMIIYKSLKERIHAGEFPQGSFLPSEHSLIEEYDCSRNTVRRAISQLADDGYVQSIHGKGVVVILIPERQALFSTNTIESMREAAARNGMVYHTKVILFEEDVINKTMSLRTGFSLGTRVWVIKRIRFIDDEPLIIDTNWLDQSIVREFTVQQAEGSLYDYLENDLGIKIVTFLRKLTVDKCTAEDRKHMDMRNYNCVALVCSRTFNDEGIQFEYTESRHRPDRFVFYTQAKRAH